MPKKEFKKSRMPKTTKKLKRPTGVKVKKVKKSRKKRKFAKAASFVRAEENPIISPKPENGWEAGQTFNPGVIVLDNKVYILYRAIGEDGVSRLGYAMSCDGFIIDERLPYPVYEHITKGHSFNIFSYFSGGSWGGAEDPRIVHIDEEGILYVTYTACDSRELRVGLTSIKISDFLNKKWNWKTPVLISPPGETHKNWVIFPEKIGGRYAILHSINPKIQIYYVDSLEFTDGSYIKSIHGGSPRKNCWDIWIRGVGPVPIKTKYGWLILYHAMDNDWSKYKVGAILLDLKDPTKVLHRSMEPILEPTEPYENCGFKSGVIYALGAVVKEGRLLVYYGGADSCVGVAHADLEKFLEALRKKAKPKLKKELLKSPTLHSFGDRAKNI